MSPIHHLKQALVNNSTYNHYSPKTLQLTFNLCMNRWQTDVIYPLSIIPWTGTLPIITGKDTGITGLALIHFLKGPHANAPPHS